MKIVEGREAELPFSLAIQLPLHNLNRAYIRSFPLAPTSENEANRGITCGAQRER